jgi:hypothetical protein
VEPVDIKDNHEFVLNTPSQIYATGEGIIADDESPSPYMLKATNMRSS